MDKTGFIEVICGPMFAGKTEELIRRTKRLEYAHKNFLIFKPEIDDRYSNDEIVSHSNYRKKSIIVKEAKEILSYYSSDLDAIVIDEVQFFSKEIVNIAEYFADNGIRVIVAGLDSDFRGVPFPVMADLLARAETVTKLTAICVVCGANATRTQRIINGKPAFEDDPIILVGAKEAYEPRCRKCHVVLKKNGK